MANFVVKFLLINPNNLLGDDLQEFTNQIQNRQRISGSIRVSARQRGNPVLKHIRKVPWEFAEGMVRDNFC